MFHLKSCFILLIVFLSFIVSFVHAVDVTSDGGVITAIPHNCSSSEGIEKLIDDASDCHRALQSVPLVDTSKCTTPLS